MNLDFTYRDLLHPSVSVHCSQLSFGTFEWHAPSSMSPPDSSTSLLHHLHINLQTSWTGQLWRRSDVRVRVPSALDSFLLQLKEPLTIKIYSRMKNATILRDQLRLWNLWCVDHVCCCCCLQLFGRLRLSCRPTPSTTLKLVIARVSRFLPLFSSCTWVCAHPFISRHTNKLLQ